ncbi:MAG: CpaF family protein [Anaerolineales bacterium]
MNLDQLEEQVHQALSDSLERELQAGSLTELPAKEDLLQRTRRIVRQRSDILPEEQEQSLIDAVVARIAGMGPLQPLLEDPSINEIMVNDPASVFVERDGRLEETEIHFRDEAHLRHIIDRIVAPLGRRIDEASPLVDARLPDGSRVNAVIAPLALRGPVLTIRKFAGVPFDLERLVELRTLSPQMAGFLERAVQQRISLLISGGTGSGKTSTLNALSLCIPTEERLITIEDSAELQLQHPHWVPLEARPANLEGEGEIPIRTLVRNALRMRPDRIVVGEVRGGEAFDMLQAMNTGHRGSLTTLHANSPGDALVRLESMVLMAGFEMPISAIRRMIGGAVELIAQQDRLPDGRRVMTAIYAMRRPEPEELELHSIFRYDRKKDQFKRVRGNKS